jgi:hypothetical protein
MDKANKIGEQRDLVNEVVPRAELLQWGQPRVVRWSSRRGPWRCGWSDFGDRANPASARRAPVHAWGPLPPRAPATRRRQSPRPIRSQQIFTVSRLTGCAALRRPTSCAEQIEAGRYRAKRECQAEERMRSSSAMRVSSMSPAGCGRL